MASKTQRRPEGTTSERTLADGTRVFGAQVSIPLGDGERSRRYKSFRTEKERDAWLRRMLTSVEDQTVIARSDVGFADYVATWIDDNVTRLEPSTVTEYRGQLRRYIGPMLGNIQVQRLTETALRAFFTKLATEPSPYSRKKKVLSPTSVRAVFRLVRKVLEDARLRSVVRVNVADLAKPALPQVKAVDKQRRVRPWTMEELRRFRDVSEDDDLAVAWRLGVMVGLRRGEVCGLRWSDLQLDGDRPKLTVNQTRLAAGGKVFTGGPKTENGQRTITLDKKTASMLREHRVRQVRARLEAGPLWQGDNELVLVKEDGTAFHPETISKRFQKLIGRAGLPHIRFHDLRHIAGSLMMAASKDVHTTSKRLGHAKSSFTMDVYGILLDEPDSQVADDAAGLLDG